MIMGRKLSKVEKLRQLFNDLDIYKRHKGRIETEVIFFSRLRLSYGDMFIRHEQDSTETTLDLSALDREEKEKVIEFASNLILDKCNKRITETEKQIKEIIGDYEDD